MHKYLSILLLSLSAMAADIDYKVEGTSYQGYILKKSAKAPVVFLVHDWDGLGDYEKLRSKMLYDLGYSVFAIDMYGKGVRPQEVKDKKAMTKSLYANRKKMRALMNGSLKKAKEEGLNTKNAIALGYCFGGTSILEWAKSGVKLKGFASFHGNLALSEGETYKDVQSKIIVFHGSADKAVSMQDFANLAIHLESLNKKHEMLTYSGAPHAFSVIGSERYHKEADQKSWQRFVGYLKETL